MSEDHNSQEMRPCVNFCKRKTKYTTKSNQTTFERPKWAGSATLAWDSQLRHSLEESNDSITSLQKLKRMLLKGQTYLLMLNLIVQQVIWNFQGIT